MKNVWCLEMNDDLSNKAIFVLVILTVVISIFSTFLLMSISGNSYVQTSEIKGDGSSSAKISFAIEEPVEPVVATGKISFEIIDN